MKTIAVFMPGFPTSIFYDEWLGVRDTALQLNVQPLCVIGAPFKSQDSYEHNANVLYDLTKKHGVDGILFWSAGLDWYIARSELETFIKSFLPIPLVSLEIPIPGIPSITSDNYNGTIELVEHLIKEHHYERFAYARGPINHEGIELRYRAFHDALAHHGIIFNSLHATKPAQWTDEYGKQAVVELLDEKHLIPGKDFECIVAANDARARSVIEELMARGYQVPGDIAVVGYDDEEWAEIFTVPLTTVRQPFYEMGKYAVKIILESINGKEVTNQNTIPADLMIRCSCGCISNTILQVPAFYTSSTEDTILEKLRSELLKIYKNNDYEANIMLVEEKIQKLVDSCLQEIQEKGPKYYRYGPFIKELESIVKFLEQKSGDVAYLQNIVSGVRKIILMKNNIADLIKADDVWEQGRVYIGEVSRRAEARERLEVERSNREIVSFEQNLLVTFDFTTLMKLISTELPLLGIPSGYIYLYTNPLKPDEGAYCVLEFTNKSYVIHTESTHAHFEFFPHSNATNDPIIPYVVEALFFNTEQIGYITLQADLRDCRLYDTIRALVSSALKGSFLIRQLEILLKAEAQAREHAEIYRKAAEEANRAKSKFLATMSHELRTPLNSIINFAYLLSSQTEGELNANQIDLAMRIEESGRHLLALINDILDLSKIESGKMDLIIEEFNFNELFNFVYSSFKPFLEEKKISVILNFADSIEIFADKMKIKQVIFNLFSNAVKYTEQGIIEVTAKISDAQLRFSIKDTGRGIKPEDLEKIFEEFIRVDFSTNVSITGTGLGLPISKKLIEMHGGTITAESEYGKGSIFTFTIPVSRNMPKKNLIQS